MAELIKHDCSVEGPMLIESGKPCNWCDKFDDIENKTEVDNAKTYSERKSKKT